jgi:hypothetical protein
MISFQSSSNPVAQDIFLKHLKKGGKKAKTTGSGDFQPDF